MQSCVEHLNSLRTIASTVGVLAFGALAFLVAVVTVFIEFGRDQVVVGRKLYRRLHWAVRLLAAETLIWLGVELARVVPVGLIPCNAVFVVGLEILMLVCLAIATLLLAGFVREIGVLARGSY